MNCMSDQNIKLVSVSMPQVFVHHKRIKPLVLTRGCDGFPVVGPCVLSEILIVRTYVAALNWPKKPKIVYITCCIYQGPAMHRKSHRNCDV